jgi:L-asparagine transporter-like permease
VAGLASEKGANAIKSDSLALTRYSGVAAALIALVTAIRPIFKVVFRGDVSNAVRASIVIAAIAAWSLIAVADMIARAIAERGRQRGLAKTLVGDDVGGWTIAALAVDPSNPVSTSKFLLLKSGEKPRWETGENIRGMDEE